MGRAGVVLVMGRVCRMLRARRLLCTVYPCMDSMHVDTVVPRLVGVALAMAW